MLRFLWKQIVRRFFARDLDALAGRGGRPDWKIVLRRGFTQGFLGGGRVWLVLGGIAAVVRVVQRAGEGSGEVLAREVLVPGSRLTIADTGITWHQDAVAAAWAAKAVRVVKKGRRR